MELFSRIWVLFEMWFFGPMPTEWSQRAFSSMTAEGHISGSNFSPQITSDCGHKPDEKGLRRPITDGPLFTFPPVSPVQTWPESIVLPVQLVGNPASAPSYALTRQQYLASLKVSCSDSQLLREIF